MPPIIIDRGRGPEIAGTRLTVYDLLDYVEAGWTSSDIAAFFRLSTGEVEAVVSYIDSHREAVATEVRRIEERRMRGETPPISRPGSTPATNGSSSGRNSDHGTVPPGTLMKKILADNDVEGHLATLAHFWSDEPWHALWSELGWSIETFASLGLNRDASDAEIWAVCQARGIVLATGNRNAESPVSLEATIRRDNQPDSLPVLTIANPRRILSDRDYAEGVALRLLEVLMDVESFRGCGRVYLP